MLDNHNDNNHPGDGGFDRLLGYLVQRLPQIRGEVEADDSLHRTLFDLMPVAVRLQDENLITRECNRAFAKLVGRSRDELIGKGAQVYVPDESQSQLRLARRTMRAELERHCRATVTVELLHAEGHLVEVVMVARPLRIDGETLVLGVYWPREELATAIESPKILSSSGSDSGSMAS